MSADDSNLEQPPSILPPTQRQVTADGMGDPKSHWLTRSIGRLIPDTPKSGGGVGAMSDDGDEGDGDGGHGLEDGACVAIDWHLAILKVG